MSTAIAVVATVTLRVLGDSALPSDEWGGLHAALPIIAASLPLSSVTWTLNSFLVLESRSRGFYPLQLFTAAAGVPVGLALTSGLLVASWLFLAREAIATGGTLILAARRTLSGQQAAILAIVSIGCISTPVMIGVFL
jgi:hypothetical protein